MLAAVEALRAHDPTNQMYHCAALNQLGETSQTWTIGGDPQSGDAQHAASVVADDTAPESVAEVAAVVAEGKPCWYCCCCYGCECDYCLGCDCCLGLQSRYQYR
jgi:hypothetical protein